MNVDAFVWFSLGVLAVTLWSVVVYLGVRGDL